MIKTDKILILPIAILTLGDLIHFFNLYEMIFSNQPVTLWNVWVDVSMAAINTSLLIGLIKKMKYAYYLTIAMFILFSLTQLVSLIVVTEIDTLNAVKIVAASVLCLITAFILLVVDKKILKSNKNPE